MLNKKDDSRKTVFIDVDGVIVLHNYDPEKLEDVLIPETLKYLKELEDTAIILTTSRCWKHVYQVIKLLKAEGIVIHSTLIDLPTGPRLLINDIKNRTDEPKAVAINVQRDKGVTNGTGCEFYKKWNC